MKIRLPILATALASTLALAPGLSQASTYQERYVEFVLYQLDYFFPRTPISVETEYDDDGLPVTRRASIGADPGGYVCFNSETGGYADNCGEPYPLVVYFTLVGSAVEIVPLDNMTFDLMALPTTLGGYEVVGQEFLLPPGCWNSFGSLTFGPSGEIAAYDMGYSDSGECGDNAEVVRASSTPRLLTDMFGSEIDTILDGDFLEGLSVYDSFYFEPNESYFSLRPGYWRTSIRRECSVLIYNNYNGSVSEDHFDPYFDDLIDVPCREAVIDPTAPIPLPAAGWLLLGALGLLGAARRRRG